MSQLPAICLIHGHGLDASIWNDIYADLLSAGPVLKPDFSRLTNHTTIDAYADDLYARLQTAQVQHVVLVGHSMGGYIALAFAERHPERVRGLCLLHSTAYADDASKKEQRTKAIRALTDAGASKFIHELLPKLVAPAFPQAQVQALEKRFGQLPADALIAGVKAMAARPDRTHVLQDGRFPVLVVLGKDDQVIPFEQARKMADLSEGVTVKALEGVGHLSMVEQPDASVQVIQEFVKSI